MQERPPQTQVAAQMSGWKEHQEAGGRVFQLRVDVEGEKAGEIVASHSHRARALYVEGVFVERRFRGVQLGVRLLREAEGLARRLSLREVMLEPYPLEEGFIDRDRLVSWYLKNGFRPAGRVMLKPIR